jgi:hypothetical protein
MEVNVTPRNSQVRLENVFFPAMEYHAFPANAAPGLKPPGMGRFSVKAEELDETPKKWLIQVELHSEKNPPNTPTYLYEFSLVAVGVFAWQGDERSPAETRRSVGELGASMLYDALREAVKYITHLGPYKPFLLPPLEFSVAGGNGDDDIVPLRKDDA